MYRCSGDGHADFHLTDRKMYTYVYAMRLSPSSRIVIMHIAYCYYLCFLPLLLPTASLYGQNDVHIIYT